MIAIYLRAGSDLTEKWFGKTNTTFLKKYIAHSDFIGDLINSNDIRSLNSNSYRKLIHSFWIGVNTDSAKISFDELRKQTQKRKNLRYHLQERNNNISTLPPRFRGIQIYAKLL